MNTTCALKQWMSGQSARMALLALLGAPVAGCSSVPVAERDPGDRFEAGNREVYAFNDSLDTAVLKPVSNAYVRTVPEPARNAAGRFFDNLLYVDTILNGFLQGKVGLKIEPATFKLSDYRRYLADNAAEIASFKAKQQAAFEEERSRWQASDQSGAAVSDASADDAADDVLADNAIAVTSPVPGAVWKIEVSKGARVKEGDLLVVVESMKMEMSVRAPSSGVVAEVRSAEGRPVSLGQTLVVLIDETPEAAQ